MQGIEGRYGGYENPTITIEGEPVTPIREIKMDETGAVDLPDTIFWSEQNAGVSFKKVGEYTRPRYGVDETYPLYEATAVFDTVGNPEKINLSQATKKKRCLFTGSNSGFFMHDPAWIGVESDFYVIGVNPMELQDSITANAGTYHELGHALLVDHGYDVQLLRGTVFPNEELPEIAQITKYSGDLLAELEGINGWEEFIKDTRSEQISSKVLMYLMGEINEVDRSIRLFHERNAWAAGIYLLREHQFPAGFTEKGSMSKYLHFCLESYARSFNDGRFNTGFSGSKKL